LLLYSSVFCWQYSKLHYIETLGAHRYADAATLCEGSEVAHKCKHTKESKKLADQIRIDQLL